MSSPRQKAAKVGMSCVRNAATPSIFMDSNGRRGFDPRSYRSTQVRRRPCLRMDGRTSRGTVPRSSPTTTQRLRQDSTESTA
jgi:hypothetical protein